MAELDKNSTNKNDHNKSGQHKSAVDSAALSHKQRTAEQLPAQSQARRKSVPASALRDIGVHEQITAISSPDRTYPIDKLEAHLQNIQHLAISIFVFRNGQLLLQQRAETKYHSPGLWANTVCSHPRWLETDADCAQRRLQEELGWTTPLTRGAKIDYSARVGELYENEQVQCFFGSLGSLPGESGEDASIETLKALCNPIEVSKLRWMSLEDIDAAVASTPQLFSAWFKIYMSTHRDKLQGMMEAAAQLEHTAINSDGVVLPDI